MTLQHLRSSTANKRPTPIGMSDGQLAMNTNLASPGLFFKDSNGDVVKLGPVHVGTTAPNLSPASGGQSGNSKGEQWLDTSGANPVLKIWDGSAWQSETGEFVNASGDTMTGALVMDNQQQIRFRETTANGTNYIALQAPASVTSDKTITLPDVTGTVVTTGDTGSVTGTMIADGTIANADINASAAIVDTKLNTISTAGKVSNSATTATSANTASAIVARDASGNFTAGTITASLTGEASLNVLKAGDLMTGALGIVTGSISAPGIYFSGDVNTGLWSPATDSLAFTTNGTQRLTVDSAGRVLVGGSTIRAVGGAVTASFAVETTGQAASLVRNSADTSGGVVALGKSRGAALGDATAVLQDDILGEIRFCGANGTDMSSIGAHIRALVDGEVGTAGDTSDMPTRLVFSTTPNGEATAAERLRIDQAGRIGVDVTPAANTKLDLNGTYAQNIVAVSALAIDCATGNYFTKTINANSTFTVSNVPASRSYSFTLELTHTSGTVTWFGGVEWPAATAPTLTTGKTHLFMFVTDDGGTRWRASSLINYAS